MPTYLVITRGDAVDPIPIAICDDPEVVELAIRAAWCRMQTIARESRGVDPLGSELASTSIRRLEAAAHDLPRGPKL